MTICHSSMFCSSNRLHRVAILQLFWCGCVVVRPTTSDPPASLGEPGGELAENVCHWTEQKAACLALMRGEVSAIYALCLFISPLSSHRVLLFLFLPAGWALPPQTPERCFADAAQGVAGLNIMVNLPPDIVSVTWAHSCRWLEWELASGSGRKTHQTHNQTTAKHSGGHL